MWSSRLRVDDLHHGASDLTPDFDMCPAVALLLHLEKPPLNVHTSVRRWCSPARPVPIWM
jgi:hypothetical protein